MRTAGPALSGKIRKALYIAETFQEEVEADFQRFYRLDFLDLYRPRSGLGWRRFLVLCAQLPPESALNTTLRNRIPESEQAERAGSPAKASWSMLEMLMATLIDEVRLNGWIYAQSQTKESLPRPHPIPRPGISGPQRRKISLDNALRLDPRLRGLSREDAQARIDYLTGWRR